VHVSSPKHFATRVLVHICQKGEIGLEIAGKVAKKMAADWFRCHPKILEIRKLTQISWKWPDIAFPIIIV
jgi:hypothetical protein